MRSQNNQIGIPAFSFLKNCLAWQAQENFTADSYRLIQSARQRGYGRVDNRLLLFACYPLQCR